MGVVSYAKVFLFLLFIEFSTNFTRSVKLEVVYFAVKFYLDNWISASSVKLHKEPCFKHTAYYVKNTHVNLPQIGLCC